jgi:hypothetical protein
MDFAYDLSARSGLIRHHPVYRKEVVVEQIMQIWDNNEPMKGAWNLLKPSEQSAVLVALSQVANNPQSIHIGSDTIQDLATMFEEEWDTTLFQTPKYCHADMYPSAVARKLVHNVLIAANRLNAEYQPLRSGEVIGPMKLQFVNLLVDQVKMISWEVALKILLDDDYGNWVLG